MNATVAAAAYSNGQCEPNHCCSKDDGQDYYPFPPILLDFHFFARFLTDGSE
jgi:hypothetical protein